MISPKDDQNPSRVIDTHWLFAQRSEGRTYPKSNENSGKWLVFASVDEIDAIWRKIKTATEAGLLGGSSKVATAKVSPNATDKNVKVICVYSYDSTDRDDVMRIRQELRELGIEKKIPYKTNGATRKGQYKVRGNSRIAAYYE